MHLLTPDHEVGRRLVDAPGVARHAGVGAGVGDVGGGDEQAARLQQGEPRQLDRPARQNPLACFQEDKRISRNHLGTLERNPDGGTTPEALI